MRLRINESHPRSRRDRPEYYGYGRGQNLGSARSDYGDRAYGERANMGGTGRGWWDRTTDEVSSWFGDDEAERRRRMDERYDEMNESRGRGYGSYSTAPSSRRMRRPGDGRNRDWHILRVGDIMTRDVATIRPENSAQHAAMLMEECDCGAIPVVDPQGRMVGMITDRDIATRLVADGANPAYARVGDYMTHQTFACHVDDSLEDCMRAMSDHQIRRIPIIDDRDRIVGIVSQADIAQHASEHKGMGERRAVTDVVCAISEPASASYR